MAYFILNERLKMFKMVQLIVAFGGAFLMIMYTIEPEKEGNTERVQDDEEEVQNSTSLIFKWICLILNPFLVAYGSIMMRQMRKLDENVVSCYMNGFAIPVMIIICYSMGSDLSSWRDFEALEWFCIFALSFTVIGSQTFRFKALQNEEASKLQPLNFLAPVYQLIADLALFAA